MDETEILDWNPLSALGLFPEVGEEVYWSGQPSLVPYIPGISMATMNRFWLTYYIGIFICVQNSIYQHLLWPVLLAGIAILFIQVLPFTISYIKTRRTAYVVTNKRIVLKLWRNFTEKTHILRYDDFQRATYVLEYPGTNNGTIYLMTGKDVGFWTYEIQTGERRQHPTLECVKDAESLAIQIEKTRAESAQRFMG